MTKLRKEFTRCLDAFGIIPFIQSAVIVLGYFAIIMIALCDFRMFAFLVVLLVGGMGHLGLESTGACPIDGAVEVLRSLGAVLDDRIVTLGSRLPSPDEREFEPPIKPEDEAPEDLGDAIHRFREPAPIVAGVSGPAYLIARASGVPPSHRAVSGR